MKIKVEFYDIDTNCVFATSEMPLEQLPETFELQTTLHLGGDDWTVIEAIPSNVKEFSQTKQITLKLSKQEKVNPKDILFSLPTISSEFPDLEEKSTESDFDILIHEDDYRQNEFLNGDDATKSIILKELNCIRTIWENNLQEGESPAFTKCHARQELGKPNLKIPITELKKILNSEKIGQVIIGNKVLKNGFSLHTENAIFYGVLEDNIVTEFCLAKWRESPEQELKTLNKAFDLLSVSWIHCNIIN